MEEDSTKIRTIEAMIISTDEPQLERCLEAVHNQTVPFSRIVHVNNVIPEKDAYIKGFHQTIDDFVMKIDGDFILYPNAVEIALGALEHEDEEPTIVVWNFRVWDTLYQAYLRGVGVMRAGIFREIFKTLDFPDMLSNDRWFGRRLRQMGYFKKNLGEAIATHFEGADEFQIFRRFFIQGIKYGKAYHYPVLSKLLDRTGDAQYNLAIRALEFGEFKKSYPTSHNLDFDREMYEEFLSQEAI
jgi:hypothetical protein